MKIYLNIYSYFSLPNLLILLIINITRQSANPLEYLIAQLIITYYFAKKKTYNNILIHNDQTYYKKREFCKPTYVDHCIIEIAHTFVKEDMNTHEFLC
jgi:hypothetical protein